MIIVKSLGIGIPLLGGEGDTGAYHHAVVVLIRLQYIGHLRLSLGRPGQRHTGYIHHFGLVINPYTLRSKDHTICVYLVDQLSFQDASGLKLQVGRRAWAAISLSLEISYTSEMHFSSEL